MIRELYTFRDGVGWDVVGRTSWGVEILITKGKWKISQSKITKGVRGFHAKKCKFVDGGVKKVSK